MKQSYKFQTTICTLINCEYRSCLNIGTMLTVTRAIAASHLILKKEFVTKTVLVNVLDTIGVGVRAKALTA